MRRVLAPLLALCVAAPHAAVQSDPAASPLPVVPLMRPWADAALRHTPGEVDSAVLVTSTWTRDEVRYAWLYALLIARVMRGDEFGRRITVTDAGRQTSILLPQKDAEALRAIAVGLLQSPGRDAFLTRAALLHTDTVRYVTGKSGDPSGPMSMLSPGGLMVETNDGRQQSIRAISVHWEFARMLLDHLGDAGRDGFARGWYRATLRHKLALEELDPPHFEHALALFPDDPDIRFLVGCLHEALADPRIQAARANMKLPSGMRLKVSTGNEELARAEVLFRRAVEADPAHHDARLRWGRTLHRRDKPREAVDQLRRVVGETREPVLRYWGQLFLAAALEGISLFDEARQSLEQALALYPSAQAPLLGLSMLAHRRGERAEAGRFLARVMVPFADKNPDADPWWIYHRAAGRRSDDALDAVARLVPARQR